MQETGATVQTADSRSEKHHGLAIAEFLQLHDVHIRRNPVSRGHEFKCIAREINVILKNQGKRAVGFEQHLPSAQMAYGASAITLPDTTEGALCVDDCVNLLICCKARVQRINPLPTNSQSIQLATEPLKPVNSSLQIDDVNGYSLGHGGGRFRSS